MRRGRRGGEERGREGGRRAKDGGGAAGGKGVRHLRSEADKRGGGHKAGCCCRCT